MKGPSEATMHAARVLYERMIEAMQAERRHMRLAASYPCTCGQCASKRRRIPTDFYKPLSYKRTLN